MSKNSPLNRIVADEKQIQLTEEEKVWLYAAIDVDSKVVLRVVCERVEPFQNRWVKLAI